MSMQDVSVVEAGPRQVSRSIVVNAPAAEVYAIVANPHRHHEFDGSGTVRTNAKGPEEMRAGEQFTVRMKAYGLPYMITSTVTKAEPGKVVEWKHPGRHLWRYEFEEIGPNETRVTETFDYREAPGAMVYEWLKFPENNAKGIEGTLRNLAQKFA